MIRHLRVYMLLLIVACQPSRTEQTTSPIQFQLAEPRVAVDSILFSSSARVTMELDQPGVEIFYALNSETVTRENTRYEGPITVSTSGYIAARAFHPKFAASDVIKTELWQVIGIQDALVTMNKEPAVQYAGTGPSGLVDRIKGSANFSEDAWMGFQVQSLQVTLDWGEPREISSVTVSTLRNHGSWIFAPIEIFANVPQKANVRIEFDDPPFAQASGMAYMVLEFPKPVVTDYLLLDIHPMRAIPAWHDGRGTTPWLFVDEIILQ